MSALKIKDDQGNWINLPGLKGDKGDKGESGVYLGTTAPSDEDINVWINPNGEAHTEAVVVDPTLTMEGQAADAKVTGDRIRSVNDKISYKEFKNLFIWEDRVPGKLLNLQDGKTIASASDNVSPFIPVKPSTLYSALQARGMWEYSAADENAGIQRIVYTNIESNSAHAFTTSANAKYIRFRVNANDDTSGFYVVEGGANFDIVQVAGIENLLIDEKAKVVPFVFNAAKDVAGLPMGNYYNKDDGGDTPNSYVRASDGRIISASNVVSTYFIPIEQGKEYNVGGFYIANNQYAFYDANKSVLYDAHVMTTTDAYHGKITAPAKASYVKFTYLANSTMQKYISQLYDGYMPYGLDFAGGSSAWLGKKVLVFGDSITDNSYHWSGISEWAKWIYILQTKKKFTLVNDSIKSTGFLAVQTGQQNALINRVDDYTDDEFDMIIIFMGINDLLQHVTLGDAISEDKTSNFKSAVDYCLKHIMTYQPSARLLGIIPLPTAGLHGYDDYSSFLYERYRYYNIPVLDLRNEGGYHPDIPEFKNMFTEIGGTPESHAPDGVHPNQLWDNNYLAPMIGSFMDRYIN